METWDRCSPSEMFLQKGVLKTCSKFAGEHPYEWFESTYIKLNQDKFLLLNSGYKYKNV